MVYRETVASSDLKRKLDELRQAGQPFDNDSLALYFEKLSHKEGTAAWSEILTLSRASRAGTGANDLPIVGTGKYPHELQPGSAWPDEPRVAEYLEQVRPIIKRVQLADSFPKPVWMPVRFDGLSTLLEETQESRLAVRILELDCAYALYHNESERALKDIDAMRSVADAFNWPFCMSTQWIAIASLGIQRASIDRSLDMNVWNEEQLTKLSAQVDKPYDIAQAWRAGYAGELAMVNASLDNLSESLPRESMGNQLLQLPIMPSTRLEILRVYETWQRLSDDGGEGLAERANANLATQFATQRYSLTNMYLSFFLLNSTQIIFNFDGLEMGRRLTHTSLAVKRFQVKNNRWPKNLSELSDVGLVQKDWRATKKESFGYAVEGDRAFVWSYEPVKGSGVATKRPAFQPDTGVGIMSLLVSIR